MSFQELWPWLRDKFPPARAVLALVGLGAPLVSAINAWLINNLPFIAEQVNGDDLALIWAGGVAALIALAYKFLDGQAKWEGAQVNARVLLAQADKLSVEQAQEILDESPGEKRLRRREERRERQAE
jgi:hypothetical protein